MVPYIARGQCDYFFSICKFFQGKAWSHLVNALQIDTVSYIKWGYDKKNYNLFKISQVCQTLYFMLYLQKRV